MVSGMRSVVSTSWLRHPGLRPVARGALAAAFRAGRRRIVSSPRQQVDLQHPRVTSGRMAKSARATWSRAPRHRQALVRLLRPRAATLQPATSPDAQHGGVLGVCDFNPEKRQPFDCRCWACAQLSFWASASACGARVTGARANAALDTRGAVVALAGPAGGRQRAAARHPHAPPRSPSSLKATGVHCAATLAMEARARAARFHRLARHHAATNGPASPRMLSEPPPANPTYWVRARRRYSDLRVDRSRV